MGPVPSCRVTSSASHRQQLHPYSQTNLIYQNRSLPSRGTSRCVDGRGRKNGGRSFLSSLTPASPADLCQIRKVAQEFPLNSPRPSAIDTYVQQGKLWRTSQPPRASCHLLLLDISADPTRFARLAKRPISPSGPEVLQHRFPREGGAQERPIAVTLKSQET